MGRLFWRDKWGRAYAAASRWTKGWLGLGLSYFRSTRQTVFAWPEGTIKLGKRVALFSHFDRRGQVHEHVLHYVRALAASGLSVVFVTNAGKLQPEALARLKEVCAGILIRRNIGYDFGGWKEALERLGLPRADTEMVLLANDSVYGPLRDLGDIFAAIDFDQADIWGLTESWQTLYHLQSYFLAAGPRVLASPAWRTFWAEVRPIPFKHVLIRRYEIGLTRALIRAGFHCGAVWPYSRLVADAVAQPLVKDGNDKEGDFDPLVHMRLTRARWLRGTVANAVPLNPTNDLWRELLRTGFPFLKRELLRDNPTNVSDLYDWREVALQLGIDITLIENDLKRTLRNRAQ